MDKYIVGFVVGFIVALMLQARAHTPCNDVYQQPKCQYVQVVNPLTGLLETQYVCK